MPQPKVIVSSTAYDLSVLRWALKQFIENHGFSAALSKYSDILYDPALHTHQSCLAEVEHCDMLILIVGGRFGSEIEFDEGTRLSTEINESGLSSSHVSERLSITQAETLTAVLHEIPVFAFVDSGVNSDYNTYRQNKHQPFIEEMAFGSITQPGKAQYIFSFLDFLRKRGRNNSVIVFDRVDDITSHLEKQWAALFQRLLRESREKRDEFIKIDRLSRQFEELKSALLATVGTERRQVARAAVRYRRLIVFLKGLPNSGVNLRGEILVANREWLDLLNQVAHIGAIEVARNYPAQWMTLLHRGKLEPYLCESSMEVIEGFGAEWRHFSQLDEETRVAVFDELIDTIEPFEIKVASALKAQRESLRGDFTSEAEIETQFKRMAIPRPLTSTKED